MKESSRKNPYRRPSLKEKYEELKKWKILSKFRKKPSKPGRKPAKSGGTIARHWRKKERDITSKYGKRKRKTPKSKYKKNP